MAEQPPPSRTGGAIATAKTTGRVIGKAGSGLRSAVNSLDNISISRKGLSTKKELSAGNVGYDRDNYVAAPRRDASHFAPPPRRAAAVVPPAIRAPVQTPVDAPGPTPVPSQPVTAPPTLTAKPSILGRPIPPRPPARAGYAPVAESRAVPPPPPTTRAGHATANEEALPVYMPVPIPNMNAASSGGGSLIGDLSSRMSGLRAGASPAPAPAPVPAKPQGKIPTGAEAKRAFQSASTVSSLYGKYGGNSTAGAASGKTAPAPSWQDVKAGAAAANDLRGFGQQYAPKTTPAQREKALGFGNKVLASQGQPQVSMGSLQAASALASKMPPAPGYGGAAAVAPVPAQVPMSAPVPVAGSKPPPVPPGKPGLPARSPRIPTCTALFSFEGQEADDLSFKKGDVIEVLERTEGSEAWWRGRCHGSTGLFPANYCRLDG